MDDDDAERRTPIMIRTFSKTETGAFILNVEEK